MPREICAAKFGMLWLARKRWPPRRRHMVLPEALAEFCSYDGVIRFGPTISARPCRNHQATDPYRRHHWRASLHQRISTLRRTGRYRRRPDIAGGADAQRDEFVGAISIYRQEVRPFTEKQIALVTNFAAQAVIAIENTRLLSELRQRTDDLSEALEQQTATSEVLKVISSSPGELEPIFQSLLENATNICGAKFGVLWLREGDLFRAVAAHGGPPAYRKILFRAAMRPGPETGLGMLLKTKRFVQIADITKGKAYLDRDPLRVATVEIAGGRTLAEVPLLKDGELIGSINIYRQEVNALHRKADRAVDKFRRPGGHRHREHAAAQRAARAHRRSGRVTGAADRNVGSS